jgi:hypothetical protein
MSVQKRELYSSPNGDKWFLSGDPDTDNVFIPELEQIPTRRAHRCETRILDRQQPRYFEEAN